jgi:hypothetical protein
VKFSVSFSPACPYSKMLVTRTLLLGKLKIMVIFFYLSFSQAVASKLHGVDVDIKIIKRKGEPLDPVVKLNEKINIFTTTPSTATTLDNQNNLQQQQDENVAQSASSNYATIDNIHDGGVNDGNDANRGDNDDNDDEDGDDNDGGNNMENCGESGSDNLCQYQTDLNVIKQCKNCLCIKMTSATSTSLTSNGSTINNANNVKCKSSIDPISEDGSLL